MERTHRHSTKSRVNFKELLLRGTRLPRATRCRERTWSTKKLYKLKVLSQEERNGKLFCKVHYLGWPKHYDEWREAKDIVDTESCSNPVAEFGHALRTEVKRGLNSSRRTDSLIQLSLPVKKEIYEKLHQLGVPKRGKRQTIAKFSDLNSCLGPDWHFRIVNAYGDFCYIVEKTVEFWLHDRKPLVEYRQDGSLQNIECGCSLRFNFVRANGNNKDLTAFLELDAE